MSSEIGAFRGPYSSAIRKSIAEFWVQVEGESGSIYIRATELDMSGFHSAPFATEDAVLRELARRAPKLRFRRHSGGETMTLEAAFPMPFGQTLPLTPLPPPKIMGCGQPRPGAPANDAA